MVPRRSNITINIPCFFSIFKSFYSSHCIELIIFNSFHSTHDIQLNPFINSFYSRHSIQLILLKSFCSTQSIQLILFNSFCSTCSIQLIRFSEAGVGDFYHGIIGDYGDKKIQYYNTQQIIILVLHMLIRTTDIPSEGN